MYYGQVLYKFLIRCIVENALYCMDVLSDRVESIVTLLKFPPFPSSLSMYDATGQTRPDETRPDQTRIEHNRQSGDSTIGFTITIHPAKYDYTTSTLNILISSRGLSMSSVFVFSIMVQMSIPLVTRPKTVCLLSNQGVGTVVIKN